MRKILLLSLLLLLTNSCSVQVENHSFYESIEKESLYEVSQKTTVWGEIFNQSEQEYYAYIYSETCGHCRKIEPEIKKYSQTHIVYFIERSDDIPIASERGDLTGVDDINSLYILGTPTLFEISDKKVKNCYIGFYEIQEHIKEVS